MDLAVVLTTFVVIFPAELPDKSMFASLVLGTRFRPLPVVCGVAAAFAVHVVIAVSIGSVFALLPQRLVLFVVAALFAGGSAWLLLGREDEVGAADEAPPPVADQRPIRVAICSRVNPSGKMIRSVFGGGASGFGGGAASSPRPPRIAQAEPTRIASRPTTKASAITRRRKIRPCEVFARWRRGGRGGGVTVVGSSTIPGNS